MLDHDDFAPSYTLFTGAKQADVHTGRAVEPNPGSIVAMDRGYNDFKRLGRWRRSGVFYGTRLKERTLTEVIEHRDFPQHRNIFAEGIIGLSSDKACQDCPQPLRCVVVGDEESYRDLVLLTNHIRFGATTIADIYRES
ncbi:MAG: hypothetical protein HC897_02410 [Thermoanaerobaculia bacterium]|nr:hypothetical protein [Thermoanaerobaculia bacterium]